MTRIYALYGYTRLPDGALGDLKATGDISQPTVAESAIDALAEVQDTQPELAWRIEWRLA